MKGKKIPTQHKKHPSTREISDKITKSTVKYKLGNKTERTQKLRNIPLYWLSSKSNVTINKCFHLTRVYKLKFCSSVNISNLGSSKHPRFRPHILYINWKRMTSAMTKTKTHKDKMLKRSIICYIFESSEFKDIKYDTHSDNQNHQIFALGQSRGPRGANTI